MERVCLEVLVTVFLFKEDCMQFLQVPATRKLMQEGHLSLEFEYRLGNMVRAHLEEGREGRKLSVCLSFTDVCCPVLHPVVR